MAAGGCATSGAFNIGSLEAKSCLYNHHLSSKVLVNWPRNYPPRTLTHANCPSSSPEYHSDPVGASDCDLHHSAGVFGPLFRGVRYFLGSALLP